MGTLKDPRRTPWMATIESVHFIQRTNMRFIDDYFGADLTHLFHCLFDRGASSVATWNVANAADHFPLALPSGDGFLRRLLPGAASCSTPPRGRRRPTEVSLMLFQARPLPGCPQREQGRCRSRSGNNRPG